MQHNLFRNIIESSIFGVCAWLGRKLMMPSKKVRMYFIYVSFLTLGSPILIYLTLTFVLNLRYMVKSSRNPVWDI
ncbi:MAG: PspC family transcriptional regulator [Bacteroidetes bacterium]|nr:PspC family transcriptional regulator [Bacteroidota bacterium]